MEKQEILQSLRFFRMTKCHSILFMTIIGIGTGFFSRFDIGYLNLFSF